MSPHRFILASASPRRRELLGALHMPFTVVPSHAEETLPVGLAPAAAIEAVARIKADEVAGRVHQGCWVLAADTAVVLGDRVLGKPATRADAESMLRALAGRSHQVITAVALLGPDVAEVFSVTTDVRFRPLSLEQVRWYASLDEPYDKAGGYAIQGQGAFLVEAINGSYTNVVGLPMAEVVDHLEAAGLALWGIAPAREACGG
ncbi:MAG: Maf family protein [Deferrisomatales bacterium]|nr:Maf family protein [Deferrisomatales bacterium]